jgi:nucleoside-diphosphate-sugar epimerase
MPDQELHVVTGAYGYTGKYIATRLLQEGHRVRTLTNSLRRANPFGGRVEAYPFNFDHLDLLVDSLGGASVLYNTYWVRFNYRDFDQTSAVVNSQKLFEAAKQAGVQRVVHVSITNPSEDSDLEYFRGKALLERALVESGLSYSILRPAVVFGQQDILINNIAWILRRFPAIGIFGDGRYRLQPIYVDDLAQLAVEQGRERNNQIINAIGPETFAYRDLVVAIGEIIREHKPLVYLPPALGYLAGWMISKAVGDVLITRDEIEGLMRDLLYVDAPAAGTTRLTDWAKEHAETLGARYASELARRVNRQAAYESL